MPTNIDLRETVRNRYADAARSVDQGCCAPAYETNTSNFGRDLYPHGDIVTVPAGASDASLGCGNPTAVAELSEGETVLDLGSGAGIDVLLSAKRVGSKGFAYGIDMTDEMLEKARANARAVGSSNVEFRKGYIEALPLEDESVDAILSNCVINLSPEKHKVYAEAYRVLRPGGRMMVSDVVLERVLPDAVLQSIDVYMGCVGGASLREPYLQTIRDAGFSEVRVERESCFGDTIDLDDPTIAEAMKKLGIDSERAREYGRSVISLHIFARK
jgi:arsenite methyltransferase